MTSFLKRGLKTSLLVLIVSAITSISSGASAAERGPWTVESHDGGLVVLVEKRAAGEPYPADEMNLYFSVSLHGRMIIEPSPLGLYMKGEDGGLCGHLTPEPRKESS